MVNPSKTTITPKTKICVATAPRFASMNCGRNAKKNIAVLGFKAFTKTACENVWRKLCSSTVTVTAIFSRVSPTPRRLALRPGQLRPDVLE